MIKVITGIYDNFEYDIRGIAGYFYPGEDFEFLCSEDAGEDGDECVCVLDLPQIFKGQTEPKNDLRKLLYMYLKKETGKDLPWGVLIGIRPSKLTMAAIREGATLDEAAKMMEEEYLVSPEKAMLAAQVSENELRVLDRLGITREDDAGDVAHESLNAYETSSPYNIYIGIPFCPTTCLYCSFTSYPISRWKDRVDEYLEAVFKELDWTVRRFEGHPCHSIYIGGGTPTSLEASELEKLLSRVREKVDFSSVKEFTVEAGRPDSITEDKLRVMKKYGVDRISINPQTMNDKTLKFIGRNHNHQQIIEAFKLAREIGFKNINMDIILGLPGERPEDVAHTIEEIKKLSPDSLTVHALAIKRASRLKMEAEGKVIAGNSDEESASMMRIACQGAKEMGLAPYYMYRQRNMAGGLENVGFSRPGDEGIYNIIIIEEIESIVALGAGTVTKCVYADGTIDRCDCSKDVEEYIEKTDVMIGKKEALFS